MQHLHSYWRMEYVEAPKPPRKGSNPFEEIPTSTNDKEVRIVWRGEHVYIVLNIYPYNAGHLMVVPYRKASQLTDLSTEEQHALMDGVVLSQKALAKALNPDGFNVGINLGSAAGAGIPNHLHVHVVPRWEGDTNFMPIVGKTKVLHRSLDAMWEHLSDVFKEVSSV